MYNSSAKVSDQNVLIAAILHDTIEDTETSEGELVQLFGKKVASVVMEVTDDKSLPKVQRKLLQIEHAAHSSHEAKLVKLADKICNLRDMLNSPPSDWALDRKVDYFTWANQVVVKLRGLNKKLDDAFDEVMLQGAYQLLVKAPGIA